MAACPEDLPAASVDNVRDLRPRNTVRCDGCGSELLARVRRSDLFMPIEDAGVARVRLFGFEPDGSAWIACNGCGRFRQWSHPRTR